MYAVHIKEMSGRTKTYNNVNNISVTSGRILLVVDNQMFTYRPGDVYEFKFCWQGHGVNVKEHYEKLGVYYNEGSEVDDEETKGV